MNASTLELLSPLEEAFIVAKSCVKEVSVCAQAGILNHSIPKDRSNFFNNNIGDFMPGLNPNKLGIE